MTLNLDTRQRAMLEEMRVRVWSPAAKVLASSSALTVFPAAAFASTQAETTRGDRPALKVVLSSQSSEVATMNWASLARAISTCAACALCVGRQAPVFAAEPGHRQADWLVVGEPPDEQEERAGSAFVGPSGELLDNMLRAVQRTRDGVGSTGARLTNVVKCRPGVVRNPQAEELAACALYLRREITLTRPKLILAMGRFAAQSLLGTGHPELAGLPFGKLRGRVHQYQGIPVVVTYPTGRLLRAPQDKAAAWVDLCLAQEASQAAT